MKKDNINLLDNYLLTEKQRKNTGSKGLNFIALFIIIVLVISAYGLKLFLEDTSLKGDNQELQAYIQSPTIIKSIQDIAVKQRQLSDLNEILVELKSLNAAFDAMPAIDSVSIDMINQSIPPDTKIIAIAFDGQWITINTSSANYLRPSEFARNLRNTNFFEDVNYYGYEQDIGKYTGTVLVALKVGQ